MSSTIVALSTPVGRSAIAVIRMSGTDAISIARKVALPFPSRPNMLKVCKITTQHFTEHAMCVYFTAPHSYTGEDSVEFHCHGGVVIFQAIIDTCLSFGAVMAQNGEFSKRAFINGKMNLSNTEGVIEMIDAETTSAVKAGETLLNNRLGQTTLALQDKLTDILAQTEVTLDYPEE
ncbi:MAG: tRNA uridine-5-carboxymethylaminomethyl(34) synthesis GTPase MnmE, partial [Clostridia bacterium]